MSHKVASFTSLEMGKSDRMSRKYRLVPYMTSEPEFRNNVLTNWYFQSNMTLGNYTSLNENKSIESHSVYFRTGLLGDSFTHDPQKDFRPMTSTSRILFHPSFTHFTTQIFSEIKIHIAYNY